MDNITLDIPSDIIRRIAREEVYKQLSEFSDRLVDRLYDPEFNSWGRYLNYDQTSQYLGISKSSLRKTLAAKGIYPIEFNGRVKVFDRQDLDRLSAKLFVDEYCQKISGG